MVLAKKKDDKINNKKLILKDELFYSNEIIYELNIVGLLILIFIFILIKLFNIKIPYLKFSKLKVLDIFIFFIFQILLYVGYILYFYSLDNINTKIFSSIQSTDIIISILVGIIFLNEILGIKKIIGVSLIIIGIIMKYLYK
jgi:drug/metabolite transporter (DMT)-like permease